jgi:hypothetical protein
MQALKTRLNNGIRHNQAWRRAEIDSRFRRLVMILISLLPWALPEAKIEAAPSALNRHKRLQLGEQIEILFEVTRQEKIFPNSLARLATHLIAQFLVVDQLHHSFGCFVD